MHLRNLPPRSARRLRFQRATLRFLCLPLLVLATGAHSLARAGSSPRDTVAIVGATLIDGTGAGPVSDAVVILCDGIITAVSTRAAAQIPAGARIVQADGHWLLPGFIDTHVHLTLGPVEVDLSGTVPAVSMVADPEVPLRTMHALLAHGITSLRDPGGDPDQLVPLRDAVAAGALIGPRMRIAGKVIDMSSFEGLVVTVADEAEVRAAVRADAAAGVDMVKLYVSLTPELLGAAVDEAHKLGIEAVAHVGDVSWTEAANLGLDNLLHIIPGSPDLLPADCRAEYEAMLPLGTQSMYAWFEFVDFEGAEIQEMIAALIDNDVSVDPTLVIFEAMVRGDDPWFTENPALELAAPSLVQNWRDWFNFNMGWTAENFIEARAAWPRFLEFTLLLYEAGVVLTAGTDANNPWVVPGHSYHRELELLVEAGIPELEVIKIATHNGAAISGTLDHTGTVEVGKFADLVLLRADPLADISNSRHIEWVMLGGRTYDPEALLARIPRGGEPR